MTAPDDQKRRLTEIKYVKDLLKTPGAFAAGVAALLMTTLTYLAMKFADGIIGKLTEQAVKLLQRLVGG
jgi:small neutral amino acid transporter SnatA (MarC family)